MYVNLQALRWEWSPTPSPSTASRPQPYLTSPLADWETHTDNESGQLFYYNPVTGQTTWESPFDGPGDGVSPSRSLSPSLALSPATPAEWGQYVDEASGQVFFYNTATGETSWDAPRVEDTLDYPEMQPALARCYSPVDRRVSEGPRVGWVEGRLSFLGGQTAGGGNWIVADDLQPKPGRWKAGSCSRNVSLEGVGC